MILQPGQSFVLDVPVAPGTAAVQLRVDDAATQEMPVEGDAASVAFPFPDGLADVGTYTATATATNAAGAQSAPSEILILQVADADAPPAPGPITVTADPVPAYDDWFERMSARPDFLGGAQLATQAELDALKQPQKATNYPALPGVYVESPGYDASKPTQKKRPIVCDADERAARIDILPVVSTDTQQKLYRFYPKFPNHCLTVIDLKLDENFAWRREVVAEYGKEQFTRHKARQLRYGNESPWITERTFYADAFHENERTGFATDWVAQYVQTSNSSTRMLDAGTGKKEYIPGQVLSWTEDERLCPQLAVFYLRPNIWSRRWTLVEYACPIAEWTESPITDKQLSKWPNGSIVRVSTWYGDENRDAIQTLDRLPMICEYPAIDCLADEWDTGQDSCRPVYDANGDLLYPGDRRLRHGYSRNVVAFLNPGPIAEYLERPKPT